MFNSDSSLQKLEKNQKYRLVSFEGDGVLIERLRELGFQTGLTLEYRGQAPFGGPHLIQFQSATIALRDEELRSMQLAVDHSQEVKNLNEAEGSIKIEPNQKVERSQKLSNSHNE